MYLKIATLVALVALWVLPFSANATIVLHHDLDELVSESDAIVHGRVVSQSSEWQGQAIVTYVTVEVFDCLKGEYSSGDRMTIFQHGGVVGDLAMRVIGAPHFATGDEVVLFLEDRATAPEPLVLGLSQGQFRVALDDLGRRVVTRSLDGLELVQFDTRGQMIPVPVERLDGLSSVVDSLGPELDTAVLETGLSLEVFLGEVERLAGGQEVERP